MNIYKLFIILILLSTSTFSFGQQNETWSKTYKKEIQKKRTDKNQLFKYSKKSLLTAEQKSLFESLPYFDIDLKWRIKVNVKTLKNQVPFPMTISNGKQYLYIKYCIITFEYEGKSYQLSAYMDAKDAKHVKPNDYLFIPFTDLSNGSESYGGGRYMEWKVPESDTGFLDFNNAFNPACVYSIKTKCPLPPRENNLKLRVDAGERDFDL